MDKIKVIENEEFGILRLILDEKENFWFCADDVATALGYKKTNEALKTCCRGEVLKQCVIDDLDRTQEMLFISVDDVYGLITNSTLPVVEKFEIWVFEVALPSIRHENDYTQTSEVIEVKLRMARDFIKKQEEIIKNQNKIIKNQDKTIEDNQYKIDFFDIVTCSEVVFEAEKVAEILNFKNVDRIELYDFLRAEKIFTRLNRPYQYYVDKEWFKVIEASYIRKDGDVCVHYKTLISQKGISNILKLLQLKYI